VASTRTRWLVHYLAVEAEGVLYPHHVTGKLPGSRGFGLPLRAPGGWFTTWQSRLRVASTHTRCGWFTTWQSRLRVASTRTRWLVSYLAVEAKSGLYPHQVAGSLPGSRG
jgi:hypothetical protein